MKITYIKTIGFRKFEKVFETNLYDITSVTGKNRSGKSNLLYAIVKAFLNTNIYGDERDSNLINTKCDSTFIEIHFIDNKGDTHTLIRVNNRFNNNMNYTTLDGLAVKQQDLIQFYNNKKLFLSIINPLFFLSKQPAGQKEIIDVCLSNISPKKIFDTLNADDQKYLIDKYYNPDKLHKQYDELSTEEKDDFINHLIHINLDMAYKGLSEEDRNIIGYMPSNIPDYVKELNEIIKFNTLKDAELKGKISCMEAIVEEKLPQRRFFEKDEELSLALKEFNFLHQKKESSDIEMQKQIVDNLESEILKKENENDKIKKSMRDGKKKYNEIRNNISANCPICNQPLENTNKNIAIINYKNELLELYDKNQKLEKEIKDLKYKLSIERCKYHALEGDISIKEENRIAIVENTIKELQEEKAEIEKFNLEISIKEKQQLEAQEKIKEYDSDRDFRLDNIKQAKKEQKVVQKLYIGYIEQKMKIAKHFLHDVDIKYYSVAKDSFTLKDDFVITYKGRNLSDLSRSETFATALEFANMFNKVTEINIPIFIDDYESYEDYDFIKQYGNDTQLILTKVQKGKALKIADYNNSKDFTTIKPTIKGCKTIKIYQKNNAIIQKAA